MENDRELGQFAEFQVTEINSEGQEKKTVRAATEIPLTISANGIEIATLLCTPSDLKELTYGFLFVSGIIRKADDVLSYYLDKEKWKIEIELKRAPDTELLNKRIYTSGCGKGIMFSNAVEIASRHPIKNNFKISAEFVIEVMKWLQTCSDLFRTTGAVHSAALSCNGKTPQTSFDDVGRHNAVDKAIGKTLAEQIDFSATTLICSGRISSEILHKAKRCGIPILLSRGAPTHQTILLAEKFNMTVIGFARGSRFTIYTGEQRIKY